MFPYIQFQRHLCGVALNLALKKYHTEAEKPHDFPAENRQVKPSASTAANFTDTPAKRMRHHPSPVACCAAAPQITTTSPLSLLAIQQL